MKPFKQLSKGVELKKCPLCQKSYPYLSRLQKHILSHTQEKPFSCDKCDFKTASKQIFQNHLDLNHSDQSVRENRLKYKCEFCPFRAHQNSTLQSHMAIHKEERKFPCKFPGCEFKAKLSRVIWKHYNRFHREDLPLVPCQVEGCAYRGKSRYDVKVHMIKHSTDRPFRCPEANCDYRGKNRYALNSHLKRKHCATVNWYECSFGDCAFKTKHRQYLEIHNDVHVGVKSFVCSYPGCSFRSRTQKGVQDHATRHEKVKPYTCPVFQCNYRTALNRSLKVHVKIHNQDRPFPCPIEGCKFRAKIKSSLISHLRWHNKDAKIPCPMAGCTYLARHKYLLGNHVKRHQVYPDFKLCPVPGCKYWARNPNTFKQHQSIHNSEREFSCPFCPKFFAIKPNFERHIFSHTKEKPLKCVYCQYGSPDKKALMEHYRVHHRGEKFSLEWLTTTVMCKYCSFVGIDEVVMKHTAIQHSKLIVNLKRIIIKVV